MRSVRVANVADVKDGSITPVKVDGVSLLLTRVAGRPYALENKCPHLGLSLSRGKIDGSTITCPWHGSKFDICTGRNLDWVNAVAGMPMPRWTHRLIALGKRPSSVRAFEAKETNGEVWVNLPEAH